MLPNHISEKSMIGRIISPLKEGDKVNFVGLHPLKWKKEFGMPEMGCAEFDEKYLTVFKDGTYKISNEGDSAIFDQNEKDWLTTIKLSDILADC